MEGRPCKAGSNYATATLESHKGGRFARGLQETRCRSQDGGQTREVMKVFKITV